MAINTRDFGNSNVVAELIIRDRLQKKSQQKWWNRIIPKVEEGQITPNGISYKNWRNYFQLTLRIYNLRMRLRTEYYNTHKNHFYCNDDKTGFGVTFDFKYN